MTTISFVSLIMMMVGHFMRGIFARFLTTNETEIHFINVYNIFIYFFLFADYFRYILETFMKVLGL
jgi:hypothetical protein